MGHVDFYEIRRIVAEMKEREKNYPKPKVDLGPPSTKEECREAIKKVKPLVDVVKKVVKLKMNGQNIPLTIEKIDELDNHAHTLVRYEKIATKFSGVYAKHICKHLRKLKELENEPEDEITKEEVKDSLLWMVKHAEHLKDNIRHAEIHELSEYRGWFDEQV